MTSEKFERAINGKTKLSPADASKYSESLNSVIYFATLPYKLQDASVTKHSLKRQQSKARDTIL
jgi:hypothetical protein